MIEIRLETHHYRADGWYLMCTAGVKLTRMMRSKRCDTGTSRGDLRVHVNNVDSISSICTEAVLDDSEISFKYYSAFTKRIGIVNNSNTRLARMCNLNRFELKDNIISIVKLSVHLKAP